MKKYLSFLSHSLLPTCFCMLLSISAFTACGDDGDSTEVNYQEKISSKRISKIVEETANSIYETILTYDSQNRVVKLVTTGSSSSPSVLTRTYQYGETLIISKEEINGSWSNVQSYSESETHSYSLSNGLIVKDTETRDGGTRQIEYTYDDNGYMKSIIEYGDAEKILNWVNGNLTNITGSSVIRRAYEYSSTPWRAGMVFYLIPNTDAVLYASGYYGKQPKMLPSKVDDETYQYVVSGDLVTKASSSWYEKGIIENSLTIFTWE